jgi:hypothetical protein
LAIRDRKIHVVWEAGIRTQWNASLS